MEEKNYHHGDLKKQMILKGLELLNEKGIDGFSLRINVLLYLFIFFCVIICLYCKHIITQIWRETLK